jgi:hypothetical protein
MVCILRDSTSESICYVEILVLRCCGTSISVLIWEAPGVVTSEIRPVNLYAVLRYWYYVVVVPQYLY